MRRAASLFTIVPVGSFLDLTRADARRAVAWLPWVGLVVGLAAGAVAAAVAWWRPGLGPLAAALGVGMWALATGAMHLDGLADTCDGLGSRRPAAEALAIMRKSDIGPMGVAAVVFAVGLNVLAAGAQTSPLALGAVLALAPMVGRTAVLFATLPAVPAARTSGFGALFAGVTTRGAAAGGAGGALVVCAASGWGLGWVAGEPSEAWVGAVALLGSATLALAAAAAWGRALVRRFGGITGDLWGAQIELAQTVFLVAAALSLS